MNKSLPKVKVTFYTKYIKRLLDILISGCAMIILSPVLLVTAILVLCFHGWPIIFAQERPGLNEEIFKIYKFRSMTNAMDETGELLPGSMRITKFGKMIRRFSIDELPELWCIITGKMSIVGPRPLLPEYIPYYSERHHMRHAVKPGLACTTIKPIKSWTWNDQFENDIWYIENCSFTVDCRIIFAIAREVLIGSDYRTNATRATFDEYNPDYIPKEKIREAQRMSTV